MSKKKYRIISNGTQYRAQKREWLFLWVDLWYNGSLKNPIFYDTRAEAEKAIEEFEDSIKPWSDVEETEDKCLQN